MARCRERPQTAMCCLELGRLKIKYLGGMHLNHLNLAKPEFFLASFLQFLSVNCISPARIIALLVFICRSNEIHFIKNEEVQCLIKF